MKKQELIHLHGLLAEVRTQMEIWDGDLVLPKYESYGVKPTSIHKSKTDHKAAVFELMKGINRNNADNHDELVMRDYLNYNGGNLEDDNLDKSSEDQQSISIVGTPDIDLEDELVETYERFVQYGENNGELNKDSGNLTFEISDGEFSRLFEDTPYWEAVEQLENLQDKGYIELEGSLRTEQLEGSLPSDGQVKVSIEYVNDVSDSYLAAQ